MPWNDAAIFSSAKPAKRALRRPKRRQQRRRLRAELLEDRRLLAAEITLVSDINSGSGDSSIADMVRVGSDLYFNADDSSGSSIWRHQPATGTTEKLVDPASGVPVQGTDLAAFGETLVFGGTGGSDGLYQYDPVADSVSQLSTIYTGGATVVGDKIFFAADDGNLGVELWQYEVSAGVSLAADIDPSPDGSWPYEIMEHNDQLYFWSSYDLSTGQPTAFAFYQFDPSTDSVSQLLPADTGGLGGSIQTNEYDVVGVGANIYLPMTNIESTQTDDAELASLPGPNYINVNTLDENDSSSWSSSVSSYPSGLTAVGGSLYFSAAQAFPIYEGTDLDGNVVVTNEFGDYVDSEGNLQTASEVTAVGDYEYQGIIELDPSDNSFQTVVGQIAGPDETADVRPFSSGNMWGGAGKLYFRGSDASGTAGLWTFDPVTRQTEQVLSDATDPVVTLDVSPVTIGSNIYLVADSASTGSELHLLSEATAPVADPGGPYVADEGTAITLDATGTTDAESPLGALQFQWDLNYDGVTFDVDTTGVSPSVEFGNELTGQTIALRVTDPSGLTNLAQTTIDVRNLPPVITSLPDVTAQAGQAITFASSVSDPGAGDTLTYTWDFGQGDPQTGIDLASPSHTYPTSGTFQGLLTVTDDADESVQQTFSVVVADPVSFAIASQTIDEADGSVTAVLTLDSPAASNITIPYTVSGTADGDDHDLVDGSVVIATGESSAEIVVQITDDQLDEVDVETLVISLGTPTGASLGNITTHEISIADNDAKPLAFLSTPFVRLEEDFGVSTNITVQLDAPSGRDVTVPIVFTGSATLNADYTVDPTSVVIPAGSQSANAIVSLINDVDPEPAETIQFSLGSSNEATIVASQGLPASGTITIAQNDEPQVWFDRLAFTRTEGDGLPLTSGPTIRVSKPSTSAITVPFTVTGAGDDIAIGPASGTVTIPAGGTHGVLQYDVIDDGIAESVTEVTITLGQPTGASLGPVTTSTLTILDDDVPTATLTSTAPPSVFESFGQIPISVQLDRVADRDVSFELRLSRGNASRVAVEGIDYVLEDGPLQITQGQTKVDRTITLIDDDSHEQTERLTVTLVRPYGTRADGTPYVQPGDQTSLMFELRDNDPLIALALSESSVDESDTTVVFEASLIGDTEQPIDLSFTVNGTATPGEDFVDPINNVFSLDGGASYSGTIQFLDDVFDEPTERLTLDFTSTIGQFRPLIGDSTGDSLSISISDDDAPPPTAWLRFDDSSVLENDGPFDLTIQLSSPAPEPLEIVVGLSDEAGQPIIGSAFADFSLSSATGSFDPATGTVTIPAGEDHFTLTVTPDLNSSFTGNRELHAAVVSFSGTALGTLPVLADFTNTSLYVYDNDPVIRLAAPTGTSIREDEGIVQFGVSVSGSQSDPISVDYVVQGTATAGFDYTGPTSGTLTVAPGSIELVTLNLINDAIPEGDEQIEVIFSSDFTFAQTWDGRTIDRVSIGVRDDFDRTPEIDLKVLGTREATEGDIVEVQVRVSPPSPTAINLVAGVGLGAFGLVQPGGSGGFRLTDGSDDDGSYTIPANAGQLVLKLPIPDDARNTGSKDLNIQILSASTSSLADQGNPIGSLQIDTSAASELIRVRDNDAPSTVPKINIAAPIDSDRFVTGQLNLPSPSSQPQSPGTSSELVIGADVLDNAQPGTLRLPIGVSNGFINGGTVFFDSNFNGVADFLDINANGLQDDGEPTEPIFTTDAEGNFSSSIEIAFDQTGDGAIDYTEGRWTIYGGTDASKGLPLLTPMTAAPGMYVINGISTLVSQLIEQHGQTLQSAKTRVAETFALSVSDLGFLDNVRAASVNDQEGNQAVVANAQIMDTVNLISRMHAALPGSPDVPYFSNIVFGEIASLIAADGAGIDLTNEATQTALIGSVGNETGFTLAPADTNAAATVIADSNAAIQSELTGDTSDLLENVVRTQIVAQTDIATALEELATGATDAATITAAYTGTNLETLITTTTPGTIIPPAIVVQHAAVEEGDEGTTNLIFQVDVIGEPTETVTVDYATLDGTATVSDSDYMATSGTLSWGPSDTSARYITVQVSGDEVIEATEYLVLGLSEPSSAILRSDVAYGYIVNKDEFQFPAASSNHYTLIDFGKAPPIAGEFPRFSGSAPYTDGIVYGIRPQGGGQRVQLAHLNRATGEWDYLGSQGQIGELYGVVNDEVIFRSENFSTPRLAIANLDTGGIRYANAPNGLAFDSGKIVGSNLVFQGNDAFGSHAWLYDPIADSFARLTEIDGDVDAVDFNNQRRLNREFAWETDDGFAVLTRSGILFHESTGVVSELPRSFGSFVRLDQQHFAQLDSTSHTVYTTDGTVEGTSVAFDLPRGQLLASDGDFFFEPNGSDNRVLQKLDSSGNVVSTLDSLPGDGDIEQLQVWSGGVAFWVRVSDWQGFRRAYSVFNWNPSSGELTTLVEGMRLDGPRDLWTNRDGDLFFFSWTGQNEATVWSLSEIEAGAREVGVISGGNTGIDRVDGAPPYFEQNTGSGGSIAHSIVQTPQVSFPLVPGVKEGEIVSLSPEVSLDSGTLDNTVLWTVMRDGIEQTPVIDGNSLVLRAVDGPATVQVTASVTDSWGQVAEQTIAITIENVSPQIDGLSDRSVAFGSLFTANAAVFDQSNQDIVSLSWDLGDGTILHDVTSISHTYAEEGEYFASLTATDSDGGVTVREFRVVVGPPVSVTASTTELAEGDAVTLTATLHAALSEDVIVPLTYSGTALPELDFIEQPEESSPASIVIPAGELSASVVIENVDDALDEHTEELIVQIGVPANASLASHEPIIIDLQDNDAPPVAFISSDPQLIDEQDLSFPLTVSLSEVSGKDVIVSLAGLGSAEAGSDYTLDDSVLVIPAGETFASTTVTILDDNVGESVEQLRFEIATSQNAVLADSAEYPASLTHVIAANDAPTVEFATGYERVSESAGTHEINLRLSNPSDEPITVDLALYGSATEGLEYTLPSGTTEVTFPALSISESLTVHLTDNNDRGGDRTITASIVDPGTALRGPTSFHGTRIVDDESLTVRLEFSDRSIWEDESGTTLTARLNAPAPTGGITVPLSFNGTAVLDTHYFVSGEQIFIPEGEISASVFFVLADDDSVYEPHRMIAVSANSPPEARLLTPYRSVTVRDNEVKVSLRPFLGGRPPLGYRPDEVVNEGDSGKLVTVFKDRATNQSVQVDVGYFLSTATNGDINDTPTRVTIPAGRMQSESFVGITDDQSLEAAERFFVQLGSVQGGEAAYSFAARRINFLIRDNDSPPTPYWTFPGGVIREGDTTLVTLGVRLSSTAQTSFTANFFAGGSATFNEDYRIVSGINQNLEISYADSPSQTITFGPGERNATVILQIIDDGHFEDLESINLLLDTGGGRPAEYEIPLNDNDPKPREPRKRSLLEKWRDEVTNALDQVGESVRDAQLRAQDFLMNLTPDPIVLGSLGNIDVDLELPSGPGVLIETFLSRVKRTFDGYIDDAIVYVDYNLNESLDYVDLDSDGVQTEFDLVESVVRTGNDGSFELTMPRAADRDQNGQVDEYEGQLVSFGGTDVSLGTESTIAMTAPLIYPTISPLTTLVGKMRLETGWDLEQIENRLINALDLPLPGYLRSDLIAVGNAGDEVAIRAFSQSTQTYSTVKQIAEFAAGLPGGISVRLAGSAAFSDIAAKLIDENAVLDLTEPIMVESILRGTLARLGLSGIADEQIATATEVITAGNVAMASYTGATPREQLESIAQAQQVTIAQTAPALADLAGGTLSPTDAVDQYTGDGLQSRVDVAIVGNVVMPYIAADDVTVVEGDSGQQYAVFNVGINEPSNLPVTVSYFTSDRSATAGEDYTATSGTLSWDAGDTTLHQIQVPILGDSLAEADERFHLILTDAVNAAVLETISYGDIISDDAPSVSLSDASADHALFLEATAEGLRLFDNGSVIFDGVFAGDEPFVITGADGVANDLTISISPDAIVPAGGIRFVGGSSDDSLTIDAATSSAVESVQAADGSEYFVIDGVVLRYDNLESVTNITTSTLVGLPQGPVISGQSVVLTGQPPAAFDDGIAVSESWTVTRDGEVVTTASGTTLDFEFTQNDTYRLTYTASQEGRLPGVATYEVTLANNDPVIQPRDFVVSDPTTLLSSTLGTFDLFGQSVAIAGDRVIVGSPLDDSVSFNAGQAFVFDADDLSTGAATLNTNTVAFGQSHFGNTMAASGRYAVIGAPLHNPGGIPESGSAFVFDLETNTLVSQLNAPNQAIQDTFGGAVAISDTHVVVGAYRDDVTSTDAGAVYVFDLADLAAAPIVLENPAPSATDQFGFSVAIDGNLVVVGASFEDADANNSGAVYVFDLSEPTSAPVTLTNPNPGANAFFGQYLAANGGQLAVYSRLDSAVGNAGTVYVYDLADTSASPLTIENPTPAAGDDFGTAMSLSGSLLAIGNRGNDSTGNNSGRVYLYDLNEPSSPIVTLDNPTPGDGDEFGFSIDLSQTKLIVGAHADDTGSSNGGATYVYNLSMLTNIESQATQNDSAFDVDLLQRAFDPDVSDTLSVDPASVTFTSGNPIRLSIDGGVLTVDPSVYAYLPEGQTEQVGFTYAITDSAGGSVTQTVSITVEGFNDAPIAVADLNATTENASVTTDVLANDTDVDTSDIFTLGFTGGIRKLNDASLPLSPDGKNITLDPSSGLEWLDLTSTNAQSYNDTVSRLDVGGDLEGFRFATAAEIENLWSTFGFVPGFESGSDNRAITEAVSFLGNLSTNGLSELAVGYFDDAATGTDSEQVGWARAFVVPGEPRWQADITSDIRSKTSTENGTGSYLVRLASPAARIASMTSDADGSPIPIGDATVTPSAGSITFDPGSDFDGLAAGQTATVVIEYILADDSAAPLTDIGSLTISVTGQNDAATIAGDGQVSVGEDVDVLTGALSVIDPDFNEALFAAQNDVERTYGKFSISATGHWTFDLNNSLTNPLEEGEIRTESFMVESTDGTATQNIQITIVGGADTDTDGVDDVIEEAIGDGNADGVADSLQDNVASLANAVTSTNVTLAASEGTTLVNVIASDPELLDQQPPADVQLPIGLFQFTALVDVGAAADVRLYYDAAEPVNAIYKFGPINGGASEYYLFEDVHFGIDEVGNNFVELHLVDGGAGDADGIANGQIVDPVGLALIPGVGNDIVTTSEDQALTFDPTVNDVLADPISMDAVSSPSFGVTAINSDGTIRYQPNSDYFGNDSFTYSVTDANGFTSTASVTVTVLPVNDTPTLHLTDATGDVLEGGLATATGTFGDVDPDAVLQLAASVGEVQDHGDGTWNWSYSPADGPGDSQTVAISVSDGLTTTTVDFSLNVNNVPVNFNAGGDVALVPADEGQFARSGILFTDPGADVWSGTVDFGDGSGEQPLTIDAANRSFDLSHTYTSEGSFLVTVKLKDDDSEFVTDSFIVSVILNQAPVANDDVVVINEDSGSVDITGILGSNENGLLGNDSDPDGDSVSIVAIDDSAITRGILQFDAGKVTFDPHGDFDTLAHGEIASQSFTYTIADPSGELSTATATIEVVGENDAPILSLDHTTLSVSEGSIATNSGTFLDVDTSDGLSLQASIGEIVDQGDGTWSWSWNTQDGPTDSQTVTISTSDGMLTVSESFPLLVVNTPPQFTNLGTDAPSFQLASPDLIVSLFGSFSDSGAVDTHRIEVNWGDGSETEDIPVHQAIGSFTAEHTYASAGFFDVTVTLVDKDGGSVTQSTTAVVQGVGLVDGKLWVIGTDDRDHIDVKRRWRYDGSGRWWRLSNWYEAIEVDARFGRQWIHESYAKSDVSAIEIVTLDDRDNIDVRHGVDKPVQVVSGNGNDRIDIRSGTATVVAGAGHDKVKTNSGDDFIDGGEGNDKIWSDAGNDIVIDTAGDNDVSTGSGDDVVTTGDGDDRVDLGSGDDIAWLGAGDDRADGGPGDDFIFGEAGDDRIDGGRGNDVIVGGDGDDRIDGDRGSDILIGGAGADRIDGGRGHDLLIAGWTAYDHDASALGRIIDEWTNDLAFNEKIDNLRSGSGSYLVDEQLVVGLTVFDDNSKDRLDGDQARDWFFASLEDRLKRKRNEDMLDLFE